MPAHQNQGKGTGLKVPDRFTVPACYHCHTLYDQSGLDREHKRATWDWGYTRWGTRLRCEVDRERRQDEGGRVMANDWIKMRTDLYRDQRICVMADILMNEDGELARYVNQHCQRHMRRHA